MSEKIMFSYWDGGECHLTRTLAIASEAEARGYGVGVISSDKYAQRVGDTIPSAEIYVIPNRHPDITPPPYPFPLYSHAFRHAQRLKGQKFDDTSWLMQTTLAEMEAIKTFRPNVIVNDYRDTIRTAAQASDVPVAGITHTSGNVDGLTFGWWVDPPKDTILPDCRDSFNEVRGSLGLPDIEDEREMFSGDVNIIPSTPSIDPLAVPSRQSHYVGALSTFNSLGSPVQKIDAPNLRHKVFSYIGEETRPKYGYPEMLAGVADELPEFGFYVAGDPKTYKAAFDKASSPQDGRLCIGDRLPAALVVPDCSAVYCHGGIGSVTMSLSLGKPVLCIGPPQTDCSTTFKEVEKQGAGILLNHSDGPLDSILAPDLGNGVEIFGYWDTELSSEAIAEATEKLINDPSYADNAARLGHELLSLGGASTAIDICAEKFF